VTRALTSKTLEALLQWLAPDRERAGARYESLRRKLIAYFAWRGCERPEELADEALDRAARRVHEGERIDATPERYLLGIGRLLVLEALKERARRRQDEARAPGPVPDAAPAGRLDCLDRCLLRLAWADRELLERYYLGDGGARIAERRRLAAARGLNAVTLRVQAHRLRVAVRGCLERCLRGAETEADGAPLADEER
jgi:hypothetical protein